MTAPSVPERQSPAFSFYPTDFLVGTATFSLEERGAYITLLSYQWDHGGVPDDGTERARLLNCSLKRAEALWDRTRTKFDQGSDGAWRNPRLETERAKQAYRRAALAANGSKGGRPKNQKENQTETNSFQSGSANGNLNESLSSSSPSSSLRTPLLIRKA
jgi:uncharacterized protein YdaU (DUF1376 family)